MTVHNMVNLEQEVYSFDTSFLEPYNKWAVGTSDGKVIVYNQ